MEHSEDDPHTDSKEPAKNKADSTGDCFIYINGGQ